jgi:hypothetical protein
MSPKFFGKHNANQSRTSADQTAAPGFSDTTEPTMADLQRQAAENVQTWLSAVHLRPTAQENAQTARLDNAVMQSWRAIVQQNPLAAAQLATFFGDFSRPAALARELQVACRTADEKGISDDNLQTAEQGLIQKYQQTIQSVAVGLDQLEQTLYGGPLVSDLLVQGAKGDKSPLSIIDEEAARYGQHYQNGSPLQDDLEAKFSAYIRLLNQLNVKVNPAKAKSGRSKKADNSPEPETATERERKPFFRRRKQRVGESATVAADVTVDPQAGSRPGNVSDSGTFQDPNNSTPEFTASADSANGSPIEYEDNDDGVYIPGPDDIFDAPDQDKDSRESMPVLDEDGNPVNDDFQPYSIYVDQNGNPVGDGAATSPTADAGTPFNFEDIFAPAFRVFSDAQSAATGVAEEMRRRVHKVKEDAPKEHSKKKHEKRTDYERRQNEYEKRQKKRNGDYQKRQNEYEKRQKEALDRQKARSR